MPSFEVFTRKNQPASPDPTITINSRGLLALNKPAHEALGQPEAVKLLFDRDEQIVGLRPAGKADEDAYAVPGSLTISSRAFTTWARIDTSMARRWPAYVEDDVLCVNVGEEGTPVTSNRAKAIVLK